MPQYSVPRTGSEIQQAEGIKEKEDRNGIFSKESQSGVRALRETEKVASSSSRRVFTEIFKRKEFAHNSGHQI
jgi:hypothetical protein